MIDQEDDIDSRGNELQAFSLVQFIHKGRKKKVEAVDIVPSKWLDFNKKTGRMVTKFLASNGSSPYTDEEIEMLHSLVQNNVDAPEEWPTYPVKVLGRATSYSLAEAKVKRLELEENVFTADDENVSEKQNKIKSAVQQNVLRKQQLLLQEKYLPSKQAKSSAASSTSEKYGKKVVERSVSSSASEKPSVSNTGENEGFPEDENNFNYLKYNEDEFEHEPATKPTSPVIAVADKVDAIDETIQDNGSTMDELGFPIVQVDTYESKSGLYYFSIKLT